MTNHPIDSSKPALRTPELETELDRIMREFDKSQPPKREPDFAWVNGWAVEFVENKECNL